MNMNGVALIKFGDCSGVFDVVEFYGVFVRGKLLSDAAGAPRRFRSHGEAVKAFELSTGSTPARRFKERPADAAGAFY
jgi:hypothetical protein